MLCNKKLKNVLACICMLVIFTGCGGKDGLVGLESLESRGDISHEEVLPAETERPKQEVAVHVCGAVEYPGVYYLEEGSRVVLAIEAAGGFSEEASADYLNLATILSDGQQVYVPTKEEVLADRKSEEEAALQLIDINTASKEVLMTLPGIGESRALDIISYREKEGAFRSVTDVMKVSGIKQSVFDRFCDMICVK